MLFKCVQANSLRRYLVQLWQVNVGGLSTGPARPLSDELKQFVDSAVNGLIVVAFGSLDVGSDRFFHEFFTAFSHLSEYQVVWR